MYDLPSEVRKVNEEQEEKAKLFLRKKFSLEHIY